MEQKNGLIPSDKLIEIRNLFNKHKYDECYNAIENELSVCDKRPDLWYIKALLTQYDPKIHNYCVFKARTLIDEG